MEPLENAGEISSLSCDLAMIDLQVLLRTVFLRFQFSSSLLRSEQQTICMLDPAQGNVSACKRARVLAELFPHWSSEVMRLPTDLENAQESCGSPCFKSHLRCAQVPLVEVFSVGATAPLGKPSASHSCLKRSVAVLLLV